MIYLRKYLCRLLITAGLINLTGYSVTNAQPANLDALHYEIRVDSINFQQHSIFASTTVWLTPLAQPVDEISLEIINLDVTAVWLDAVPVTDFTQGDSLLAFGLPAALQPGDTAIVKVDYQGVPFHEDWGGFHFSGEYAFNLGVGFVSIPHNLGKSWFPCIDNFTDRATYDVYCTMPAAKMAVCGGLLSGQVNNGNGTTTYHWHMAQPILTYLISLAAGNYFEYTDTFAGMNGPVPISIYTRPQDTNKVAMTFVNLKEILAIYEDLMGPYSWDRVGYTGTELGAMEHAANIFIPHGTISGNTGNEWLHAHELAHMWMGDKVTCSSAEEMWINEGWATFFQMYYALALYNNPNTYKQNMRNKHCGVLQYCHTSSGDGSYFPLNQIPQQYTYGMAAYDKGATVCQAMRFYLGDSLFFETLAAFIDEFAFQDASSYDMRDFMSGYTGIDMSGFFDNFVLNSGTPNYAVDSFAVGMNVKDLYDVTVFVRQKRKGPAFTANGNIMEVMFMDGQWNKYTDTIHFDGLTGHSTKMVPFIPSVVLVDPEEKMCDATTDNYKTIKTSGSYNFDKTFFSMEVESVTDSAFVQVTHNWVAPDSLKSPVPGLRLSDYRYWRIEGIFPENFQAAGKFAYTVFSLLDNTLITSSADTITILYRRDTKDDWEEVPFEKYGIWSAGTLTVYNMQPGEYTLAVKEPGVGFNEAPNAGRKILEIYPNPSSSDFTVNCSSPSGGELRIYSDTGSVITEIHVQAGTQRLTWSPVNQTAANYIIAFFRKNDPVTEFRKVIYTP